MAHSEETKEKIRKAALGRVCSAETRSKMSATRKGRRQQESHIAKRVLSRKQHDWFNDDTLTKLRDPETRARRVAKWKATASCRTEEKIKNISEKCSRGGRASWVNGNRRPGKETGIERSIAESLSKIGIVYEKQKRVGSYRADFFLPEFNAVVECDGEYWHSSKKARVHDLARDAFFQRSGILVFRLKGSSIALNADACIDAVVTRLRSGKEPQNRLLDQFARYREVSTLMYKLHVAKSAGYGDSWCQRGHVGVFMNLARKWDRLENIAKKHDYDFKKILSSDSSESFFDTIADLGNYAVLWMIGLSRTNPDMLTKFKASVDAFSAGTV